MMSNLWWISQIAGDDVNLLYGRSGTSAVSLTAKHTMYHPETFFHRYFT